MNKNGKHILSNLKISKGQYQHAHTHFRLGVHVPPGTGIWEYKLKFEGTPFGSL